MTRPSIPASSTAHATNGPRCGRPLPALHDDSRGFTLIEVLVALTVVTIALLAIAGMFPTGYKQVADAGRMTLAVTAARQILEDVRSIPFANLPNLNGFNSANPGTLPAANPERAMARRWAYGLAGNANGYVFTPAETAEWATLAPFGGTAALQVTPGPTATTWNVTVTVTAAALTQNIQLSTIVAQ